MATAILNLLGKETNMKRQKTKDQHMHIEQSVLITYCFGLNSWKLSQVACALVIFLVKSKFSQVWILSIDYRQYISLFYHSWLISANLKVYFQESSISFHFAISLETARKYCRHQNRWCGKWYSADPQFPVTTSRTLTRAAWEIFTREYFWEIFPRDRFYATCHQSRENWQPLRNWRI